MKKRAILSLLIIAITSCGSFSPNSVTIDGKTYKTGFYKYYGNDLQVLNIKARDFSTSEHKEGKYHFWKFENDKFQMYFGENEDSLTWNPTLYCLNIELKEAKQYYSDLDNYNYYFGQYLEEESYNKVEDKKYFDAIEYAIKVMVTKPFSRKQNKKIDLDAFGAFTFFRMSNDNLFTSTRDQFLYSEETGFIYLSTFFADTEDAIYYTLSKENNELLTELYKSLYQKTEE